MRVDEDIRRVVSNPLLPLVEAIREDGEFCAEALDSPSHASFVRGPLDIFIYNATLS